MLLVVWAASFGVDEYGVPIAHSDHIIGSVSNDPNIPPRNTQKTTDSSSNFKGAVGHAVSTMRRRKERSEAMLREVLELVDVHAVIRRPTWDGVRVLLLILPLLEGWFNYVLLLLPHPFVSSLCLHMLNMVFSSDVHPLDRLTMHEASLSQVHSLCNFAFSAPGPSSHSSEDAIIRARIFWYAYMQEGITTGMRGGRLVLYVCPVSSLPRFATHCLSLFCLDINLVEMKKTSKTSKHPCLRYMGMESTIHLDCHRLHRPLFLQSQGKCHGVLRASPVASIPIFKLLICFPYLSVLVPCAGRCILCLRVDGRLDASKKGAVLTPKV